MNILLYCTWDRIVTGDIIHSMSLYQISMGKEAQLKSCSIGLLVVGSVCIVLNAVGLAINAANAVISCGIWGGAFVSLT